MTTTTTTTATTALTRRVRRRTQHDDDRVAMGPAGRRGARGGGDEPGGLLRRGGRAGVRADDQEVRTHAGADRRRDGAGCAVPVDLPLRVRRGGVPYGVAVVRRLPGAGVRGDGRAVPGHGGGDRRGRGLPGRPVRPVAVVADPFGVDRDGPGRRGHDAGGVGLLRHDCRSGSPWGSAFTGRRSTPWRPSC